MTRYHITDRLRFWLVHLAVVPAVFIAAFFGPMLYEMFTTPGGSESIDSRALMMAFGFGVGSYSLGAAATGAYALGLHFWQRQLGGVTLVPVVLLPNLIFGGFLLLAGSPAIADGKGAVLLPGGRDFGVSVAFLVTALSFVAVFFLCRRLKIVERVPRV